MTLEQVKQLSGEGCNCAQIVFASAAEEIGVDFNTAIKTATCFGGGAANNGEICGAVSGALMAIGAKYGNCAPGDVQAKEIAIRKANKFMDAFKDEYESVRCKDILGYDFSVPKEAAQIKRQGITAQTCPYLIAFATELLKEFL